MNHRPIRYGKLCAIFVLTLLLGAPHLPLARDGNRNRTSIDLETRVRQAVRLTYIHGVTREIALQQVGPEGVPFLRTLLADEDFPRRDNVVAFLAHLGGSVDSQALVDYLASPPVASLEPPAEDRAALLVPQALGYLARHDPAALDVLLEMTADSTDGGLLQLVAQRAPDPDSMRDDLLEMSLLGLAYAGGERAKERLFDIAQGRVDPAHTGRALNGSAWDAIDLHEDLHTPGADDPERYLPGATDGQVRFQSAAASGVLDSTDRAHDTELTFANHPALPNPMTAARVDEVLEIASLKAGRADFAQDVACCVSVSRSGTAQTFGEAGDGLDVIDNAYELALVMSHPLARFKVVRAINFCGAPGLNIAGCAWTPGNGVTVVRLSHAAQEAVVWIHEYGHNTGLAHNAIGGDYLMFGFGGSTNNGLTQSECDQFHNPPVSAAAIVHDDGTCADGDADLVQDSIDNCPTQANHDQSDADGDGAGDVCDSGSGPSCGNDILEGGEECDGSDMAGATCEGRGFEGGSLGCSDECELDESECTTCGNGVRDPGEACDGSDLGQASCQGQGFGGGNLSCRSDCTLDDSACDSCGNGVRDPGEACDGSDLGEASCQGQGFGGGNLSCRSDCTLDDSACTTCGNGVRDPGEACDGSDLGQASCQGQGFGGGNLSCRSDCTLDESSCSCVDEDGDGVTVCGGDCDDGDAEVYPGAPEREDDGIDQDCDGLDETRRPRDRRSRTRHQREACGNGQDDDGDGQVDCADSDCAWKRVCR